jgi:hypothetical protein
LNRLSAPAGLCLLLALPAGAETPLLSIQFGDEVLNATAADIQSILRVDEPGKTAGLAVRLVPGFDSAFADLTSRHVNETGEVRICGAVAVKPRLISPIYTANFVITDPDTARIDQFENLLSGRGCDPGPES